MEVLKVQAHFEDMVALLEERYEMHGLFAI